MLRDKLFLKGGGNITERHVARHMPRLYGVN
jgi:hypothetical protein